MATAHGSEMILISVEHTAHCHVDFGRAGRTLIYLGAHANLDVSLLGYDDRNCTPVCNIHTCNHTPMTTAHGSGLILISVEYTTHYCYVDFGRLISTMYVYLFWCIFEFECVVASLLQ